MRPLLGVLTLLVVWLFAPSPVMAQRVNVPLDTFIREVAYLWSGSDARSLAELIPEDAQILLDTGSGMEVVQARHAAAALRALFNERRSVSVRPARIAVTAAQPQRGFGELTWSFRGRGASTPQISSVFVGAVWRDDGWRITELRLMR
jgi:hypothetical protein